MRTRATCGLAIGLALAALVGCQGRGTPKSGFHILSKTPEGQLTEEEVTDLAVVFDRPMVGEKEVGPAFSGSGAPLVLLPAVAGSFRWKDPQTVVFHAARPLPRSTAYAVRVMPSLRARDGSALADAATWSFTSARLKVDELLPKELRWLPPTPALMLSFTQAVEPAEVVRHCRLSATTQTVGTPGIVAVALADPKLVGAQLRVPLRPVRPLRHGQSYLLTCAAELHGTEGPLGLAEPYSEELSTYGAFSVVAVTPSDNALVTPDDLDLVIEFSNPVNLDELRQHLSSEPPLAKLTTGSLDSDGHCRYRVRVDVPPEEQIKIQILEGLKDEFGQALAGEYVAQFRSQDAAPELSLRTGRFAVETALARYPLWTRNLHSFAVEAARVPDDQLVKLLGKNYDDSMWARDAAQRQADAKLPRTRPASTWAAHHLAVHRKTIALTGVKNKWQDTQLDLVALAGGGAKSGVYGLTVWSDEAVTGSGRLPEKEVLVNVTNLGLLAKLGVTSSLLWAVHLADGKVAPGVRVEVRNQKNEVTFAGTTSPDGTLALPGKSQLCTARQKTESAVKTTGGVPLRTDEHYDSERAGSCRGLVVIAREGADLAVLPDDWSDGVYQGNFNLPHHYAESPPVRGFLQTDRGLYRPGEVVHIKGLTRQVIPGQGLRVPTEKSLELVIKDPKDNEILRRAVPITRFGGFSLDVPLAGEAGVGDYQIEGTIQSGAAPVIFRDRFFVEEYRVATFAAKLSAAPTHLQLGQSGQVSVQANYLYGAALTGGQVHFEVRRRDRVTRFASFPEYSFSDFTAFDDEGDSWWREEDSSYSGEVSAGDAKLDGKGQATFRFDTQDPARSYKTTQDFLITARITDDANHVLNTSATVIAHRSPLYLGVHSAVALPKVGTPFAVLAVAVDPQGKPSAAAAELVVTHRDWHCGISQDPHYYQQFRCTDQDTELVRRKVTLSPGGPTSVPITVARPGTLRISLRRADGHGQEAVVSEQIYVLGIGESSWQARENGTYDLVASQKRYRPGDTAQLLLQAPLPGATALLTVEREGIFEHQVLPYQSGEAFRIPITNQHMPNVYASVVLVRGRTGPGDANRPRLAMGLAELEVDSQNNRLAVQVQTDKPSYRPGETVKARVSVRAADGRPVVAEVALAAADEGVLQLIGYKTPNPADKFYAPCGLGIHDFTSLNQLARTISPKLEEEGSEGGDSGDASGRRKKFLSTAFWAPALVTSAEGMVEVSFPAPDNLTAFRLMATAADMADRFGSGDSRLTVAKPLLMTPALPRFLTAGDQASVGVVIHNHTGAAGLITVSVSAQGVTVSGLRQQQLQVPHNGSHAVVFAVSTSQVGTAKLVFHATLGKDEDAVEYTFPVQLPVAPDLLTLGGGEVRPGVPAVVKLVIPTAAQSGPASLEIALDSRGGLSQLGASLRYLIEYPYGCLEQTLSKVIPMLALAQLADALEIEEVQGPKLREFVEAGVAKILRHEDTDGFSLWPNSPDRETFLNAYALYGLNLARRAGYVVPQNAMDIGVRVLNSHLQHLGPGLAVEPGKIGGFALALDVLAELGKPNVGAMAKLYELRADLPLFGRALLARAMQRGGGAPAAIQTLRQEVTAAARPINGETAAARIFDPRQEDLWRYMSTDVRTTAIALQMLLAIDAADPLIPQLAKGLLVARVDGRFATTQESVYALVALAEYAKQQKVRKPSRVVIAVDSRDKPLLDLQLSGDAPLLRSLRLPLAQLKPGMLTVTTYGAPVTFDAAVRYVRPLANTSSYSNGFTIERSYEDPKTHVALHELHTGEAVRVVLRLHSDLVRYHVALVDHLPAGLDPLNPRLSGERAHHADEDRGDGEGDDDNYWDAMEMHDDRIAIFRNYFPVRSAAVEFSYMARATTAGTFAMPAATVEEMYNPAHRASTASGQLKILLR